MSSWQENLTPIAKELNDTLKQASPETFALLSSLGRRLYFPKGILSQSAEAKGKRFNATIGIATEHGAPMALPSMQKPIQDISAADAFSYAPPAGRAGLRERWREKLLAENPSLHGKAFGMPIVTSAITHGLAVVADLFMDPGDCVIMPDKLWGNYRLTFEVRLGAKIYTFPFYRDGKLNTAGFAQTLAEKAAQHEKLIVLLNFPNNPTGYMPTVEEAHALSDALVAQAKQGTKLLVICDDAYFGLFYHLGGPSITESIFGLLCNRHPNLLAVKLDGATKELFVWGLRCGFLTFGPGDAASAKTVLEVLDNKTRGAIRGVISNSPQLSQSLVEQALASSAIADERKQKCELLRERAKKVDEVARREKYRDAWEVYPFNSGYFMCIEVKGVDAEALRKHLLEKYDVGLIATSATDIRVAFSCLELDQIEPVFQAVYDAIQELRRAA